MKIQELLQNTALTELKMSPSSLRMLVAKIPGAKAGMEFEMYVPGAENISDSGEFELDMEMDDSIYASNWDDLVERISVFFSSGEFAEGGRNYYKRKMEDLPSEDYTNWMFDKFYEWAREGNFEDWYREENPGEKVPEVDSRGYNNAMDQFQDDKMNEFADDEGSVQAWLKDERIDTYFRFGDRYDFIWPHMTGGGGDEFELESIAADFSDAVGMPANISMEYHGRPKSTTAYTIEPDSSLDKPEGEGDGGLEFVSPPLAIDKMIDQLNKVKEWAGRYGAYTNKSTGLHINVSVPGFNIDKLDYVKLALFVGDDWVANQFGRLGSHWAKSSLGQVKDRIKSDPDKIPGYMEILRQGLAKIASKLIHSGHTEKYVTINTKDNRVEFRAPGGDWLDTDLDKLVNTMLRFVVALDIAMNPEREKKEYVTKLYKLLADAKVIDDTDTIKYFAQYSAKQLPAVALKSFVRYAREKRTEKKEPNKTGQKLWQIIFYGPDGEESSVNIKANSDREAINVFKQSHADTQFNIKTITPLT